MGRQSRYGVLPVACIVLCGLPAAAGAAVVFFSNPDGQVAAADPTRDLGFQAALTLPFTEIEFDAYGHGYVSDPSPLFAGSVNVRPNLLDAAGNNAVDLALNGSRLIETWPFVPVVPGVVGGGAGGAALLNRVYTGTGPDVVGAAIEFTFSEPVEGFGAWIMDDTTEANGFVLKITEAGGATWVSPLMDSDNGTSLAIEGFLGAVSSVGIVKAIIEQQTLGGAPSSVDFFYLDHLRVGGQIPEPATLSLIAAGVLLFRRKRETS